MCNYKKQNQQNRDIFNRNFPVFSIFSSAISITNCFVHIDDFNFSVVSTPGPTSRSHTPSTLTNAIT